MDHLLYDYLQEWRSRSLDQEKGCLKHSWTIEKNYENDRGKTLQKKKYMITTSAIHALTVPGVRRDTILRTSEITHLQASSNYTYIHHVDRSILASKTLRHFHDQLCSDHFIRIHHSYSVNVAYIDTIDYRGNQVILSTGEEIPISRARKRMVKEFFRSQNSPVQA